MFTVQVSLGAIIQPAGGWGLNVDEGARESRTAAELQRGASEEKGSVTHTHTHFRGQWVVRMIFL